MKLQQRMDIQYRQIFNNVQLLTCNKKHRAESAKFERYNI